MSTNPHTHDNLNLHVKGMFESFDHLEWSLTNYGQVN